MDNYVTINPSGTEGGGLFRDKHQEHCIRAVKNWLRSSHGCIDDLKLEKEIGGLSVITEINQHHRRSVLRAHFGKEHSKDYVGEPIRELLEENVAKYNPFNKKREAKYNYVDKPLVGLYSGLTEELLDRFVENKRREFRLKYL